MMKFGYYTFLNVVFFNLGAKLVFLFLAFIFALITFGLINPLSYETKDIVIGDVNLETIPNPNYCKLSVKLTNDKWQVICTVTK